ncbi:2OG-Fe(II) oxygenase [Rhodopila sp.]|uniref:2OG-Fe(II) oxygenase n=1 Tax=Rhodopila sp. TaxID=2480087 RepID=UPI003D0BB338
MRTIDIPPISAETLVDDLAAEGFATRMLLPPDGCRELAALYDLDAPFRKRVVMEHHAYGRGEYKYFGYDLPEPVSALREALYPPLAVVANAWRRMLGEPEVFPSRLQDYLARCHAAGQTRATPLLLRYGPGGFNCLHQDLYGEMVFPLQATVLLNAPDKDFTGGEFILVEQRPRAQSRPAVVPLRQGEAVIFPVHHRPGLGTRGAYRLTMRHGVSRIRSGQRHTLGLIFHDAA